MPVTVSYPGVYVQEQPSGSRAIAGVGTSVTLFVGMARRGRLKSPVRIFNFADFEREFGGETGGELARQVSQFYINGGGTAWVCRIADATANQAQVTLRDEQGTDCLTLTARDHGMAGNFLRAEVDYNTASPERTFNLTVFRSAVQPDGTSRREDVETYEGLSMDPASGTYVPNIVNGSSSLITAEVVQANLPANPAGISIGGLVLDAVEANVENDLAEAVTASSNSIRIRVGDNPPVTATLSEMANIANSDVVANIAAEWQNNINTALGNNSIAAAVAVEITGAGVANDGVEGGRLLRITSLDGPVVITPSATNDATVGLMLGESTGGVEGDSYGDFRPAPTGVVARTGNSANGFDRLRRFASAQRGDFVRFDLVDDSPDSPHHNAASPMNLGAGRMYEQAGENTLLNARGALDMLAESLGANTSNRWNVSRSGFRLALSPTYGTQNTGLAGVSLTTSDGAGAGYDIAAANEPFEDVAATPPTNVAAYTIGSPGGIVGPGPYQGGSVQGVDGGTPQPQDYRAAYNIIRREVDQFNLMVLPRAEGQDDDARKALWGPASAFCVEQRAFLLVDPRSDWGDITAAEQGVDNLRIGVETRNSAVYWPRLRVANGGAQGTPIDPSGSIAGLMARTDGNRGVWKAPAGLEATIRGVVGTDRRMSDPENGVLNKKALNAIRTFPAGVISWGARTLVGFDGSGNVDDKYIPVRRTMLFIEESLYRGLRFAVFEPNDEPLWAQIRLAAGSFMNGLFRQGAFAGATASEAYFVTCDSSTTTTNDINLGIVNVIVGFAPLKPAEFVVLTIKQIAGQAEI